MAAIVERDRRGSRPAVSVFTQSVFTQFTAWFEAKPWMSSTVSAFARGRGRGTSI